MLPGATPAHAWRPTWRAREQSRGFTTPRSTLGTRSKPQSGTAHPGKRCCTRA